MTPGEFARRRARIESEYGLPNRIVGKGFRRKALRALVKRAGAIRIVPNGREVGYRMREGGVACAKQRFRVAHAAESELFRIGRHASHAHIPVRVYVCDWCGGIHLTSRA
jgi:hypothetical protein